MLRLAFLHSTFELFGIGEVGFLNMLFVGSHVFEESLVVNRSLEGLFELFGRLGCAVRQSHVYWMLSSVGSVHDVDVVFFCNISVASAMF